MKRPARSPVERPTPPAIAAGVQRGSVGMARATRAGGIAVAAWLATAGLAAAAGLDQAQYRQDQYQGGQYQGGQYQGGPYQGGQSQGGPYQGGQSQGGPYQGGQYRNDQYRSDQYRQDAPRQDPYAERGGRSAVPGGTYQQSCSNIRQEGSTLIAICTGERGRRFETSIDLNRCGRSDIGNNFGTLDCNGVRGSSRRAD